VALRNGNDHLFVCSCVCLSPLCRLSPEVNAAAAATKRITDMWPSPPSGEIYACGGGFIIIIIMIIINLYTMYNT